MTAPTLPTGQVVITRQETAQAQLRAERIVQLHPLLVKALKDCVAVMERELSGLSVIQPELRQATVVLSTVEALS